MVCSTLLPSKPIVSFSIRIFIRVLKTDVIFIQYVALSGYPRLRRVDGVCSVGVFPVAD
jgi:hypothetical protein